MNYLQTTVYIESLSPTTQKPCLERIEAFLNENGRPQDRFASIHVAGTNGKGSTVAILDALLRSAGMRVGRYTGPHLLRWNERFHVDGEALADDEFARLATRLRVLSEEFGRRNPDFGPLTWFEFLTALAFFYFAECDVDIAVVEVGLGGKWDATNVLAAPLATVVTNVSLDHTHILGDTVEQIAGEKAGIIKPGIPVVTACEGTALNVVRRAAREANAPLYLCVPPEEVSIITPSGLAAEAPAEIGQLLSARSYLSLAGSHQKSNALLASLAVCAAGLAGRLLASGQQKADEAYGNVYWPGRLQFLPELHLALDGAHNPAGALTLRQALDEVFPGASFAFVLGCFENKDTEGVVGALVKPGDRVFACEASSKRAVLAKEAIATKAVSCGASATMHASVGKALENALSNRGAGEIVVATGSFATVKEAMLYLGWARVEDGLAYRKSLTCAQ